MVKNLMYFMKHKFIQSRTELFIWILEISDDTPFKLSLPVGAEGFARGVRNGGKLNQNFRKLRVFGLT